MKHKSSNKNIVLYDYKRWTEPYKYFIKNLIRFLSANWFLLGDSSGRGDV